MSGISAQYADGLEFRIKELGEQVEELTASESYWKAESAAAWDKCEEWKLENEKLTKERDASISDVDTIAQHNIELQQQLAALAEQNKKMRKALTKWRYLDSSYNWRCGPCGNEVEKGHKKDCALSLTNLATPVLNRIKAEAYREAADIVENIDVYTFVHGGSRYYDGGLTLSSAATAIRAKADELEQSK